MPDDGTLITAGTGSHTSVSSASCQGSFFSVAATQVAEQTNTVLIMPMAGTNPRCKKRLFMEFDPDVFRGDCYGCVF
jgi:hypothetical protein